MAGIGSSESGNPLIRMAKGAVMQPILFIQSLPHVTAQISKFGLNFVRQPVVWLALVTHGVLLILPAVDLTAVKPEEEVEVEPEEPPVLEVQNLSDLIGEEPPEEELTPPEPEEPPPEEPVAPPPEEIVLTDVPEDLPEPDPESNEPESLDSPELVDTGSARRNVGERISNAGPTATPAPLDFKPKQRACFFDFNDPSATSLEAPLLPGLDRLVYRTADTTEESDALLDQMISEFESQGDQLIDLGIYAEALLYELLDTNSNLLGYVTLVESKGGFGWYAGVWDENTFPDDSACFG